MRLLIAFLAVLGVAVVGCGDPSGLGDAPDMRGNYSYIANIQGQLLGGVVSITTQNGGAFSGTYSETAGSFPVNGSVSGVTVNFTLQGPGVTVNNNGTLSGGNVTGMYVATVEGFTGSVQGSFTLTRTG